MNIIIEIDKSGGQYNVVGRYASSRSIVFEANFESLREAAKFVSAYFDGEVQ